MKNQKANDRNDKNVIVFPYLTTTLRVIAILFGLLVMISNITDFHFSLFTLIILSLGVFCLIVGLLESSWTFNLTEKKAYRKYGLFFLPFTKVIPFSEIQGVYVFTYTRTYSKTELAEIELVLKNGKRTKLDYDKSTKIMDSVQNAKVLQAIFYAQEVADLEASILNTSTETRANLENEVKAEVPPTVQTNEHGDKVESQPELKSSSEMSTENLPKTTCENQNSEPNKTF